MCGFKCSNRYAKAGAFNVTVWVMNDVSNDTTTFTVNVVDDIKNLSLTHASTNLSYDGQKRFELRSQRTLRNVKIAWDFGDGYSGPNLMPVFSSSVPLTVDHYYDVGNRIVRVNVSNERTYQVIEKKFYIEEKLSGLSVSCSSDVTEPLKTLYLHVSFQTGSNVTLFIEFGDGNKRQSVLNNHRRDPYSNYYAFVFSNTGIFNISVRVYNTYSEMTKSIVVNVETPIREIFLSTGSVVELPSGQVKLSLSFTGNTMEPCCMTCSTYIKGVYQQTDAIALIEATTPTVISTVWPNENAVGMADIEVLCENKLGNLTLKTWTVFERKIENVSLEVSRTSIVIGGNITVSFCIGVGSHVQYQYDLGNGVKDIVKVFNDLISNYTVNVVTTYQLKGVYSIKLNVSNRGSTIIKSVDVKVLEQIKGLKLSRYYILSDLTNEVRHGHGPNNDIFPLERPVIFDASVSSGNEIIYVWKFGTENGYITKDAKVTYKFKNIGSHLISVNASNGLYFEYKDFNITMEEIINPYSLNNDGPKKAYQSMTFVLKLSNPGTNPCFIWKLGDISRQIMYNKNNCQKQEGIDVENYEHRIWNISDEIRHQHMYTTNGTFKVKVTLINLVSRQIIENIAVITGVDCFYPIVHIIGGGQRIDEPVGMYRSEWINLESSAEVNCSASRGPEYHWKIFKVQQGDNYFSSVFDSYEVSAIQMDHFKILFPPNTFSPGLYRISLNVSMIGIPGISSEHYTYLNISKTPLVVKISGGTARNIGYDSTLILDAYEMTRDPDSQESPMSPTFSYEWRCRKENEVFPSDIKNISIPSVAVALNETRLEGCFGTGIGKLPYSSGRIEFSTLLLDPHSKNIFEVHVKKDTREGIFQQSVEVIDGDPPLIQIK